MRKILCVLLCVALLIPAGCGHVRPSSYALRAAEPSAIEADGLYGFGDGIVTLSGGDDMLLADADGKLIANGAFYGYSYFSPFENGRAKAQREGDSQWVYIDTLLREVGSAEAPAENTTQRYDSSETTGELGESGDYLFGIKGSDGEYITEPIFAWISDTADDYNYATLAAGEHRNVMISPRGEVLATLPDNVKHAYQSGDRFICKRDDDAYIFTDLQGKVLNDTGFSAISNISEGLRAVMVEDKLGLMDERGRVVLEPMLEIDEPLDYKPWIWQDRIACIKDGKLTMVTIEAYAANGTRLPRSLHGNVSPADLTDEQAQELMRVLMPKQIEIELLFSGEGGVDYMQPCPINGDYYLSTDTRFSCVQDIKDYISGTVTDKVAQVYFDTHLDSAINTPEGLNEYIDYEGKLYRNTASGGKGFATDYLVDTARIVRRTKDTVEIEMDTLLFGEPDSWVYAPTLVKTDDGWRVDNDMYKGYESE